MSLLTSEQTKLRIEKQALDAAIKQPGLGPTFKSFHAAVKASIAQAIDAAYTEAGLTAPPAPEPGNRWQGPAEFEMEWTDRRKKSELRWARRPGMSMQWTSANFGTIVVEAQKYQFGQVTERGINAWASINVTDRPEWLCFRIMHKLNNGTRLLLHRYGKIQGDATDREPPIFAIKVEWQKQRVHNGSIMLPRTSWPGNDNDNIDLVLLDKEGCFVQLQLAVTTRRGKFWFSFQEVYAGQVARTTKASAEKYGLEFREANGHIGVVASLYDENANGKDFLLTVGMAHDVVPYALARDYSRPFTRCSVAVWDPEQKVVPVTALEKGWEVGEVSWFNLAAGSGRINCADGEECYVHFSNIIGADGAPLANKGQFPVLDPMTQVLVKYENLPEGRTATSVRAF